MGEFRIVIEATGNHGCERRNGDMDIIYGCGSMSCPDCQARAFVKTLRDMGIRVQRADFVHWPSDMRNPDGSFRYPPEQQVVDDLLTRIRSGSFPDVRKPEP